MLGVVWRRLRRVLLRALHIDENANKEVEPDVHRIDGGTPAGASLFASADDAALESRRRQGQAKPEQLRWTTRLFFAFIATLIPVVTVFVVAPFEIVAASSDSLYVVFSLALSALRERAFNVTIAVVATLGVCAYVQAMFLNTGLPPADGKAVEWDAYTKVTVVSVLVWLAMLAAGVLFSLKKPLAFKGAMGFVSIALVIAQGIGLGTLFTQRTADGSTLGSEKPYTTMQGMMSVSDKSNVIVFILFLIPGLPKDVFTYITPLTHMSMKNFVLISNFARIPGIVLSTYAAAGLVSGNIVESVIIFAVTAAVAIVALVVYGRVTKKSNGSEK